MPAPDVVLTLLDAVSAHNIDTPNQELGKVLLEVHQLAHPGAIVVVLEDHQRIHVAFRAEVVAQYRAEDVQLLYSIRLAQVGNLFQRQCNSGVRFHNSSLFPRDDGDRRRLPGTIPEPTVLKHTPEFGNE